MTAEESVRFYEARQAYFDKCEEFQSRIEEFFQLYKPKKHDQHENHDT